MCCSVLSHSVMSKSLQPHRLQPGRLLCPWDSPGKNTGVGCHALLQDVFPTQGSNPGVLHCKKIIYRLSHQGNPRILQWVAYPFSRGNFPTKELNWGLQGSPLISYTPIQNKKLFLFFFKKMVFQKKEFLSLCYRLNYASPSNSNVQVLTPSTSECDWFWRQNLWHRQPDSFPLSHQGSLLKTESLWM